jgi:dTDP-4-amino-4,6-dideoxygalactose transaminase
MATKTTKRSQFLSFQPPALDEREIEAVAETLRSGWLTTGPRTAELEARMREYLQAEHVLAVASGTAALHMSLVALGIGPGDEVVTTSLTWPATANVVVHCGATPVFADIRDDTLNVDPERVRELITERTKAIVPVDLYGQPCDLDELMAFGLPIVEDAAHAAESVYRGRKVGAIADVTCFSLYATKNIAAGEGGLIATNRADLAEALDDLRVMRRGHGSLYDIAVPGYKANLSDVLASIALVQLDKVEEHAAIRRRHVALYDEGLAGLDGVTPVARDPRDVHANHLYVVRVSFADRDDVQRALADENIGSSIHFLPVHELSAYRDRLAAHQPPLPVTERAGREVLSLPMSPAHSDEDVRDAIAAFRRVHERLS